MALHRTKNGTDIAFKNVETGNIEEIHLNNTKLYTREEYVYHGITCACLGAIVIGEALDHTYSKLVKRVISAIKKPKKSQKEETETDNPEN